MVYHIKCKSPDQFPKAFELVQEYFKARPFIPHRKEYEKPKGLMVMHNEVGVISVFSADVKTLRQRWNVKRYLLRRGIDVTMEDMS